MKAIAQMIVTLIGYRGSGKTTVAEPLARRLGWESVDADAEIERSACRTIREIFAEGGEPAFRQIERAVMQELLRRDGIVLAAGGREEVAELLARREPVYAEVATLVIETDALATAEIVERILAEIEPQILGGRDRGRG